MSTNNIFLEGSREIITLKLLLIIMDWLAHSRVNEALSTAKTKLEAVRVRALNSLIEARGGGLAVRRMERIRRHRCHHLMFRRLRCRRLVLKIRRGSRRYSRRQCIRTRVVARGLLNCQSFRCLLASCHSYQRSICVRKTSCPNQRLSI